MNTDQIISDLAIVVQIIRLTPTPARLAAAAVMLRAAADAIETTATDPDTQPGLRPLQKGETIQAGDVYYTNASGEMEASNAVGQSYMLGLHFPHFRPSNINH